MAPDPIPVDKPSRRQPPSGPQLSSSGVAPPRSQYQPPPGPPPPPQSSSGPPPPPRSGLTPQQQRLSTLARLAAQLDSLTRNFAVPHVLHFAPTASAEQPKLTFDAANKPVLELDDGLTKLLLALDGVESDGDATVRDERKRLVKAVEAEIDKLDRARRDAFERQQARGAMCGAGGGGLTGVHGGDSVGELRNGGTPGRGPAGGVPPPPRAADGTEARIYQHRGPDNHWNDSPPVILRRSPAEASDQPAPARNKRASMRRPPPTNFFQS